MQHEDRREHLAFIQNAIGRMSSSSTSVKSWLLPVVTAAYGAALARPDASLAVLGASGVALFALLDAHYLRQERAFRALYKAAVRQTVEVYDMTVSRFLAADASGPDERDPSCSWAAVARSWSIASFYGPLLVAGVAVFVVASCR